MGSANFAFLAVHDTMLVTLGSLADRYFRDDPSTAIFKLRQFAELNVAFVNQRSNYPGSGKATNASGSWISRRYRSRGEYRSS
jgi:hypothetical protein